MSWRGERLRSRRAGQGRPRIFAALVLPLAVLLGSAGCGDGRPPGQVIVARDAVWRFTVDPEQARGPWRHADFDDRGWDAGPGPLGFGADGLGTETPRPMDAEPPHLSTWHRHAFEVEDPSVFAGFVVRYARDDGLELSLNGTPIVESNLPVLETGPAGPEVAAPLSVSGEQETRRFTLPVDPALLRPGRNLLAAQVRQERPESSDQRLEVELLGVGPADPAVLLRGPYLQRSTPGSVVVRFRTSRPARASVRFGALGGPRDREVVSPEPAVEHALVLDGLEAGSQQVYEVRVEGRATAGGGPHRLRVPPRRGSGARIRLVAVGDAGTGNEIARAVRDGIARALAERPADGLLLLGDYAYPTGTDAEMQEALFDVFRDLLARVPVWPVMGNHEEKRSDPVAQVGPFFDAFTLPADGEAGGLPSGSEAYYAFDVGPAHVVALDSADHGKSREGPMVRWAAEDLRATDAPWRIAFLHHAPHSGGTHGYGDGHQMRIRSRVMPTIEAAGADLVLGGHSHGYERSFLLHGLYDGPEALRPGMILDRGEEGVYRKPGGLAEGTVYVVAGMGGAPGEGPFDHPAMAAFAEGVAGAVVIDVEGCRLELRAIGTDGQPFDRFAFEKGPPCPSP